MDERSGVGGAYPASFCMPWILTVYKCHCLVGEKIVCWPLREFVWCLFQVRVVVPYQGPSSDYVVVRMIPDSRLPPRHLHVVRMGKTSAVIKWESPYDSPDQDLVSRPGVLATLLILDVVWFGGRKPRPGAWSSAGAPHPAAPPFPPKTGSS